MKILLVKPYNLSDHIQPSLGLGYLATSVRERHEVKIIDCVKEGIAPRSFYKILDREKPDVVGIQCYTYDMHNVGHILKQCKDRSITTVLGGPHPSAMPVDTMIAFEGDLDYLFHGESEIGLKSLLGSLETGNISGLGDIPGLVWRNKGVVCMNDKYFETDIDKLGMPAWDMIKPDTYPEAQHGAFFKKFPIAPIMTTRGCPYSCTFCAGNLIGGKRIRKRSVPAIIEEIQLLYNDFGIREFHIVDDNFTFDSAFAKDLLRTLRGLELDISWAVPNGVRIDALDEELLDLMKDTGLYLISLGIESGSDKVLRLMRKNTTIEKIKRAVEMIRSHGIDIAGFFIIGFPGETIEDIKKTMDLSLELDLLRANFFTYLPFPGTESYDNLKREGRLSKLDFKKFYFMNATFTPEGINKGTLKRLQQKAFLKFFLRPHILFRNISQIRSVNHFKFLAKRFLRWMFIK